MDALIFINFYLIPGIIIGLIYAGGAIGITMTYAVIRFANLAHGDLLTFGAFMALTGVIIGLPLPLALVFSMFVTAILVVIIDKLFYAYLRSRPRIIMVMASLGVAFMVRAIVQVVWGTDPLSYSTGISRPLNIGGLLIKTREIWTFVTIVSLMVVLLLFMKYSKWGQAMRALASNAELVELSGINSNKLMILTWLIVGSLIAVSGFFMGLNTEIKSMMGWNLLLPMFAAAILGGVGRIEGAILGGLIIGIAEELSVLLFPAEYKTAIAFLILIVVLLFRPSGLLKGKTL